MYTTETEIQNNSQSLELDELYSHVLLVIISISPADIKSAKLQWLGVIFGGTLMDIAK